jgi:hypothetical protein
MSGYKDFKDYIYVISAIIYVAGMFPLYFFYQASPANFGISDLSYISIGGAFLVFLQFFAAAWTTQDPVKKENSSGSMA